MGFLDSLTGGNKDYGKQYRDDSQKALNRTGQARQGYGSIAGQGDTILGAAMPAFLSSLSDVTKLFKRRMTDAERAGVAATTFGDADRSRTAAMSHLTADLAQRGLSGSGIEAGAVGAFNGQFGGQIANSLNAANEAAANRETQAALTLPEILRGAVVTGTGIEQSGLSGQTAIDQFIAQMQAQMAGSEAQRGQAESNGLMDIMGGLGINIGDILAGFKKKKAT